MSRCLPATATLLAAIGCLALPLPLSANGVELCPDGELIPADISGLQQLALVPVDEGGSEGAWNLHFCESTGCFYALGELEEGEGGVEGTETNVGFMIGRDAHGAMVIQSCDDAPNSTRPFTAVFFESDPESLPEGMENPAPDTDNCIREMERHKTEDGQRSTADACLVMGGNGDPALLIRKNDPEHDGFMMVVDPPLELGGPGECDKFTIPNVKVKISSGGMLEDVLVDVELPTTQPDDMPPCMVALKQSGEEALVLGSTGLPQPDPGDIDGDGVIDIDDVRAVLALRNQSANPPGDRTDLDEDGIISVLDARIVATMCTFRRCARAP